MRNNLCRAAYSYEPSAVIILKIGIDAFCRATLSEPNRLSGFQRNCIFPVLVRVYDGNMTPNPALRSLDEMLTLKTKAESRTWFRDVEQPFLAQCLSNSLDY